MKLLGFISAFFIMFLAYKTGELIGEIRIRQSMFARCVEAHIPPQTCLQYVKDL